MPEFEVRHYVGTDSTIPFVEWHAALADRRGRAIILLRVGRLQRGLFGDCKHVGAGVWELRVDFGPGYRVYFGRAAADIVLLLCGGDKRRQDEDIARAKSLWTEYRRAPARYGGAR